ncbi:hypothetical protein QEZ40_003816 [Streptomyces katrae]|uniref:Uncharacterized protein n=1 Tax=Streptomyces katrae TaxID=68223 RepID=A0ABT7GYC2_9ACTN|nr:hypothetical protein [Streptomyces katrae]MDK9498627.1 hypothetical protein [Streptomyces katrae]
MHTLAHRWPVLIALVLAGLTFADGQPAPELLAGVLAAMPLFYLFFGTLRGELRRLGALGIQLAALAGFAAIALAAELVNGRFTLLVLAAGWLGHALWDAVHYHKAEVVPRAWSQWCGVFDACGALALLLAASTG